MARQDDDQSALEGIYTQSNFSSFHHDYTWVLPDEEIVLFGYLCSKYSYLKREGKIKNRWFYCTIEQIALHLNMKRTKQFRLLKALKDRGYLETRQRKSGKGPFPKRFLRINFSNLHRDIQEAKSEKENLV